MIEPLDRTRWLRPLGCAAALLTLGLVTLALTAQPSRAGDRRPTAGDPGGRWRGKWLSQSTGHQGPLGARIRPVGPDRYVAWFYGRFAGVIPFAYRTSLQRVAGTPDLYQSSKRLPFLGTYQTTARITPDRLEADFVGRQDRGVFMMSRRR